MRTRRARLTQPTAANPITSATRPWNQVGVSLPRRMRMTITMNMTAGSELTVSMKYRMTASSLPPE